MWRATGNSHVGPTAIAIAVALAGWLFAPASAADDVPASQFISAHCLACHDSATRQGGLDLTSLDPAFDDAAHLAVWVKVHDRVRDGEMPPADADQPPPEQRAGFVSALGQELHAASLAIQNRDGRAVARRLNRDEYQNTLRDLLSIGRDYRTLLPEDDKALGFDKVATALSVSAEHLESYLAVAQAALDDALASPPPPKAKVRIPQRLEDLTRLQQRLGFQYAAAPDALVLFSDLWDNIEKFVAQEAGFYRFRVRARAWQSTTPVKARIRVGRDLEVSRRVVTYDEFPPAGAELEITAWLEHGETLRIGGVGIGPRGRNASRHRVPLTKTNPASRYKGPGLALEWVEVEGPLRRTTFLEEYLPGVDPAAGTRADAERVLSAFLPRAFRRPVSDAERAHFLAIFTSIASEEDFTAGLKGAIQAVLCSPRFLYLHGPPGALDDYALAARLSYFLWSSMPDDALVAVAAAGELHRPEVLRDQVERMLADPRAEAFSESFTGQWLDLRKMSDTTPDPLLYPEFDELLQWSSVKETRAFFDEILKNDLSLLNFVQSDFALLNDRLAKHYGILGVEGIALRKVKLPAGSVRGGLLGQASILKVTANGTTSSPVLRGAWVMDRILGQTPPPPPAAVPGLEPDIRGATTFREQLAQHSTNAQCAACHAKIDPPGFALENFDVIGGWRERYRTSLEAAKETRSVSMPLYLDTRKIAADPTLRIHCVAKVGIGPPVDGSGEFRGRPFRNLAEFRRLLLDDPDQLARALVTKLVIYSTGTGLQFADRAAVEELVRRTTAHNYGLRTAIHELVQSPVFLNR